MSTHYLPPVVSVYLHTNFSFVCVSSAVYLFVHWLHICTYHLLQNESHHQEIYLPVSQVAPVTPKAQIHLKLLSSISIHVPPSRQGFEAQGLVP